MSILGIDFGEKRIGLAIADSELKIALPFKTVKSEKEIEEICKNRKISKIIIGLPRGLSGKNTEQTQKTKEFAQRLKNNLKIPINFQDERLTSKQAEKMLQNKHKKEDIDAISAQIILQTYLDSRK